MVAAAELIAVGGAEAATTRAVAEAAAVQAPTIYRLFGDKRGLLDAVAEQRFADYVAEKVSSDPGADPLKELRTGWMAHIAFGLANPAIFALINTPSPGQVSRAAQAGLGVLQARVRRLARTGLLRVSEERAVDLIHAIGTGVVLTLLHKPPGERAGLAEAAWEAVLAAILTEPSAAPAAGPAGPASALRATLNDLAVLTAGERALLDELLRRIAEAARPRDGRHEGSWPSNAATLPGHPLQR